MANTDIRKSTPARSHAGGRRWTIRLFPFVIVCALWGLGFVAVKVSLRYADPLLLATVRMFWTGFFLLLLARIRGSSWLCARGDLPRLALFGMFNAFGVQAFMYASQTHVSAGLAGILLYTYPIITAVAAPFFLFERLTLTRAAGVGCGFAGVAFVAGFGSGSSVGEAEMLGAAACWAAGTLVFKRFLGGHDIYLATGWAFVFGGAMGAIALVGTGSFSLRPNHQLWWWLAYTIAASVVANAIWFRLLRREDAAVAATHLFMTPLFSTLFGWLLLSEHPGRSQLLGAVFVAAGIVLVSWTRADLDRTDGHQPKATAQGPGPPGARPPPAPTLSPVWSAEPIQADGVLS